VGFRKTGAWSFIPATWQASPQPDCLTFAIAIAHQDCHKHTDWLRRKWHGNSMTRFFTLAFLLAMLAPAAAQTPDNGPKLLENEQIKVRELQLKAGGKVPSQSLPNTFLYALSDGSLVFTQPGRTPYELSFKAGEALWLPSQQAAMSNDSGKDIRALLVEIKQRPVAAAKPKGKAGKGAKPKAGAKPAAKGTKK
jgi:hypothetical protein